MSTKCLKTAKLRYIRDGREAAAACGMQAGAEAESRRARPAVRAVMSFTKKKAFLQRIGAAGGKPITFSF